MNQSPTAFTVVIPLFNKEAHIIDTINSILKQTVAPRKIIVVDDGSTDNGPLLVECLNNPKVRLIRQKNAGVSAARNTGIEASTTEYVALLDADDQWEPHFLQEMDRLTKQFPDAGIYSAAYQYRDANNHYLNPRISKRYCPPKEGILTNFFKAMGDGDLPVTMSSMVMRRSLYNQIGGFPLNEPMGEDQDFLFRAALAQPIAYTPNVLAFYVLDSDNRACVRNIPKQECPFSARLGKLATSTTIPSDISRDLQRCRAAHILHLVRRNYEQNDLYAASRLLHHPSCNTKPLAKLHWRLRILSKNIKEKLTCLEQRISISEKI